MKWFFVSVFLCVVGKCFSMSFDELQDFSNYLKETSLLDQPLKKNPVDESDDDEPISDHAWEESGRFEGDLILNDRQRQLIVKDITEGLSRNGLKDSTKRWPDNEVIYYIQREHFTEDQVQAILNGIDDLARASCVKFRPYKKGDRDAVVVQGSRRGCFSQVGYQGGYQVLNLSGRHPVGRGCFRHGTVVHEFLHTLGFYHMQSSPDRDDFIDVIWENIVQPARHNFRKYNLFSVSDFGVGYDYDSVLHYSRKAFSSNGGDTLVPKQSGVDIGQRIGLSDKDTAKLNKMYCDSDSNNFEAEEAVPHKPIIKKKKPKNKPFDGHGIGYHQGKTVAIKLPAAETYRLPDTPSYQVFDYFSKAPQAMSPTLDEGDGIGKEITYSYTLPDVFKTYEQKYPLLYSSTPSLPNKDFEPHKNDINQGIEFKSLPEANYSKNEETMEDLDEKKLKAENTKAGKQDFLETFNKVGEDIQSRSHPDLYKPNTDYSELYNPVKDQPVTTKTDYYLNYEPSSKGLSHFSSEDIPKDVTDLKRAQKFINILNGQRSGDMLQNKKQDSFDHNKYEIKRETPETAQKTYDEQSSEDVDLSYGKVYPRKKLQEIKSTYSLKPEYTSLKYLQNKQDYSNYYKPNDRNKENPEVRNAQYTVLGELVPVAHLPKKYTENDSPARQSNIRDVFNYRNNPEDVDESSSEQKNSSEIFDSKDTPEKQLKRPINRERSSYEVTEIIKMQVETATENPTSETHQLGEEHVLEDRLPKILEGYTKFDIYDIASPYTSSEYDNTGESHEKEESPDDFTEAEY